MQINFTGIKNVSSLNVTSPDNRIEAVVLNAQLTDDYEGKDLSAFKETLRKTGGDENYNNPLNSNFINIVGQRVITDHGIVTNIILNNKPLPPQRNTVSLYTFLAKLTRAINTKPNEKFEVNSDYLTSDDFNEGVILGYNLNRLCGDAFNEVARSIVYPPQVKHGATSINQIVQDIMLDYLA